MKWFLAALVVFIVGYCFPAFVVADIWWLHDIGIWKQESRALLLYCEVVLVGASVALALVLS